MAGPAIPLHQLPGGSSVPTRVERILPTEQDVRNDVHRHAYHEVFLFRTGNGSHMIDLRSWPVSAPAVHVVAPGQVHRLERSADMEGLVVLFGGNVLSGPARASHAELFLASGQPPVHSLEADRMAEAWQLVELMERELEAEGTPQTDVVNAYLGILLLKCAQWAREQHAGRPALLEDHDPVRRFLELLEHHFLSERQVAHYAGQLSLTPDHLNELVKERLGRTASTVVQERLLLEAERLLVHGGHSIKEVAYALNMQDPAYFTRWFRKMEGTTPVQFRDTYQA